MSIAKNAVNGSSFLTGLWYFAGLSRDLKPGHMVRRVYFGEPVVMGRTQRGEIFALRDICPHRAAPLSKGRIVEGERAAIECPYHGWRFRARDGVCASIPSLSSDAEFDAEKVRVRSYPVHETNGIVWIYWPENGYAGRIPAMPPPDIGVPESWRPQVVVRVRAEGPYDEAVIGLIDPAHTPYVHRQWWWREGAGLKEKTKTFEPTTLGFRMPPHPPSSNSRIYRFLGGAPTTEIEFRLPALRLETIKIGKRTILGLTAMTPTAEGKTEITHLLFWNHFLLSLIRPITQRMAQNFLAQDGAILRAQNRNLSSRAHRPLYIGDPDELAKWYLQLKRAWGMRAPGADFENPITGAVLRWRT